MVKLLLEASADANAPPEDVGSIALHAACYHGGIIKLLLEARATVTRVGIFRNPKIAEVQEQVKNQARVSVIRG